MDPTPYLRSIHIPKDHRAHVFVPVDHFKVLRSMLELWGVYAELYSEYKPSEKVEDAMVRWTAASEAPPYMAKAFYRRKQTELNLAGYTILEGLTDPTLMPDEVLHGDLVNLPNVFPQMPLSVLFERIYKEFHVEATLWNEDSRGNWNPIVNSGNSEEDQEKRDKGVARYSSTPHFLMNVLES